MHQIKASQPFHPTTRMPEFVVSSFHLTGNPVLHAVLVQRHQPKPTVIYSVENEGVYGFELRNTEKATRYLVADHSSFFGWNDISTVIPTQFPEILMGVDDAERIIVFQRGAMTRRTDSSRYLFQTGDSIKHGMISRISSTLLIFDLPTRIISHWSIPPPMDYKTHKDIISASNPISRYSPIVFYVRDMGIVRYPYVGCSQHGEMIGIKTPLSHASIKFYQGGNTLIYIIDIMQSFFSCEEEKQTFLMVTSVLSLPKEKTIQSSLNDIHIWDYSPDLGILVVVNRTCIEMIDVAKDQSIVFPIPSNSMVQRINVSQVGGSILLTTDFSIFVIHRSSI